MKKVLDFFLVLFIGKYIVFDLFFIFDPALLTTSMGLYSPPEFEIIPRR
jgi:hypothetical protein